VTSKKVIGACQEESDEYQYSLYEGRTNA